MPQQMFREIADPSITVATRKWYAVPLSALAHILGLAAIVVVPLVAADLLPTPESVMVFVAAPPRPPQPAPPPPPAQPAVAPPMTTPVNMAAAPLVAPQEVTPEPLLPGLVESAGVPGGIPHSLPAALGLLAPPPSPTPPTPERVRPGGDIKDPRKIHDVRPIYPAVAMAAKVEGMVIIEATISREGHVTDAHVIRSQPLLDQAALDAVRQWKFTPTTLNGVPVEVIMTVTVNFTLR